MTTLSTTPRTARVSELAEATRAFSDMKAQIAAVIAEAKAAGFWLRCSDCKKYEDPTKEHVCANVKECGHTEYFCDCMGGWDETPDRTDDEI